MKAVITGASNFVGRSLAEKMMANGWSVVAVVREGREQDAAAYSTEAIGLDMEDYGRLGELTGACDCFIHSAWDGTRGTARQDERRQKKNVVCSVEAVRSVLKAGCKKVITAGSQAEYGQHAEKVSECTPCDPETAYGKAKLEVFRRVSELCRMMGVCHVEPRFFSLYGPGDRPDTMVMSVLRRMLRGEPCEMTKCTQQWDFLYIQDAAEALFRLCAEDGCSGIYNFGSGDSRPLREYVQEMAEVTGTKSELRFGAAGAGVPLWPDITRLTDELDWRPKVAFKDGIRLIIDREDKMIN